MKKVKYIFGGVAMFSITILGIWLVINHINSLNAAGDKIPGQYIVIFKDSVVDSEAFSDELSIKHGFTKIYSYKNIIKGFSAKLSDDKVKSLKNDTRIKLMVEDHLVEALGKVETTDSLENLIDNFKVKGNRFSFQQPSQVIPTGIKRIGANLNANKGAGIGVAIIDTGIDLTHPDLQANIVANTTCISGTKNGNDDNGHGTHVAGTIAALDNSIGVVGVAPQAKLIAVKVLNRNGSGTWSSVICGIDWVTSHANQYNIKIANMSLGGTGTSDNNCGNTNNDPLHQAICRSTQNSGVTYVVAAGNSAQDSANSVPASYSDTLITVSALADSDGAAGGLGSITSYGADDTFATFSNFGSTVELGAPGVSIYSAYKKGTYATLSGTSMASPHVAGSAALYIKSNPGSLWSQVRNALVLTGEPLNFGHTDPSGLHPEPVVKANNL